jgi:protein ImuB
MRTVVVAHPQWAAVHGTKGPEWSYQVFDPVVRSITAMSPLVEVVEPGHVVFASRGPSRYFGGDVALAMRVHEACGEHGAQHGVSHGVGIGDSRFVAEAASRVALKRRKPCVVESTVTHEFLGALPVEALHTLMHVPEDVVDLFRRLGLHTCAALRGLGEVALVDRFGAVGRDVYQLVTGHDVVPIVAGAAPAELSATVEFEAPLTSSGFVVATARACIEEMVSNVARHGLQCVRVHVLAETDHAEQNQRIWGDPHGFTAPAVAQRLQWQLDAWFHQQQAQPEHVDAPTSGVVRVQLVPLDCRATMAEQPMLWGGRHQNNERAARAVHMATTVHADVQAYVPQWSGGRDVSGAYQRIPAALVDLHSGDANEERVLAGSGVPRDWSGAVPAPSPTTVHAPGEMPVQVLDAQGHMVAVTGRHELTAQPSQLVMGNTQYRVLDIAGPWPVEERWWDPLRRRRMARVQALVRHPRGAVGVMLLCLENRMWSLVGTYD